MSWLCLNCETLNFDTEARCMVCHEERYYKASEVSDLLEQNPQVQDLSEQLKKLTTQNKWLQTRNKNLSQQLKEAKEFVVGKQTPEASRRTTPTPPKKKSSWRVWLTGILLGTALGIGLGWIIWH